MKLRFSVTKDGKEIAAMVADVQKKGDIAAAIELVLDQARSVYRQPLWDCEIALREVKDSN